MEEVNSWRQKVAGEADEDVDYSEEEEDKMQLRRDGVGSWRSCERRHLWQDYRSQTAESRRISF